MLDQSISINSLQIPLIHMEGLKLEYFTERECMITTTPSNSSLFGAFRQTVCPNVKGNGVDARCEISHCDGYGPKSSRQQMKRTDRRRGREGGTSISTALLSFVGSRCYRAAVTRKGRQAMTGWETIAKHRLARTHPHENTPHPHR